MWNIISIVLQLTNQIKIMKMKISRDIMRFQGYFLKIALRAMLYICLQLITEKKLWSIV